MTDATPMRRMLGDFAPAFVGLTDHVLFGQVWARTAQRKAHLPMGPANGLSQQLFSE